MSASIKTEIKPEILSWLVEQANVKKMTPDSLKRLKDWQSGLKEPTFAQILAISTETKLPLGYFFLNSPPVENYSFMEYRTVNSQSFTKPSRDLIDVINHMENVQDWMRDYLIQSDGTKLSFVGSQKNEKNVLTIANLIRDELNLKIDWFEKSKNSAESFKIIRKAAQNCGILVMISGIVGVNTHRPLDIEEFRAFALIDEYAPLIFINTNDSSNAQLFSLLHEIVHIWYGRQNIFNDRTGDRNSFVNKIEQYCNAAANEILVPDVFFTKKWNEFQHLKPENAIQDLSKYFNCGTTVIARNALDNGLINKKLYEKIANDAYFNYLQNKQMKNENGGGNHNYNLASYIDNRFLLSLASSVREGKTQYTDAFQLTKTNRKTFAEIVNIVGER